MGWLVSNWVQRRAATEQNLRNAADAWRKAQAAVVEASDSFRQHYSELGAVSQAQPSTDVLMITIERGSISTGDRTDTTVVSFQFCSAKPSIVVTVDQTKIQEFWIAADSNHAFLVMQGNELAWDEFSRLALEEAFFPSAPVRSTRKLSIVK